MFMLPSSGSRIWLEVGVGERGMFEVTNLLAQTPNIEVCPGKIAARPPGKYWKRDDAARMVLVPIRVV